MPAVSIFDHMGETVSVCMITKDEERYLEKCLQSVYGFVDEIVVVDTGSKDRTVEIARSFGLEVFNFTWSDDFASARNAALDLASSDWILSLDADEWVEADWAATYHSLQNPKTAEAILIEIDVKCATSFGGDYTFLAPRLFRRTDLRWYNRVHEKLLKPQGNDPELGQFDPSVLKIVDIGYQNELDCRIKAQRNYALSLSELADSQKVSSDRESIAQKLFEVGRSLVTLGRREESLQYFEGARNGTENLMLRLQSTDFLARQLLSLQRFDHCKEVVTSLRKIGGDPKYCDWLSCQALAQTGKPREALALLRGLNSAIDTLGINVNSDRISEFRLLCQQLVDLSN